MSDITITSSSSNDSNDLYKSYMSSIDDPHSPNVAPLSAYMDYETFYMKDIARQYRETLRQDHYKMNRRAHLDYRLVIQKNKMLKMQMKTMKSKCDNLDKSVKERQELDSELFNLRREHKILIHKMDEKEKEFNQYKTNYKDGIVNTPILKNKIEELLETIRKLNIQCETIKTECKNKDLQIKDIQDKLEHSKRNYENLQSTINKDNKRLRVYENNLHNNMREVNKNKQEQNKINSTIKILEDEIRLYKAENRDYKNEQRIKDIKYAKIDKDYDVQVNKVKELRKQLDISLHEKCHLEKENQNLKNGEGKKIDEIRSLNQKYDNLNILLEKTTVEFNEIIEKLNEKISVLLTKLVKLKKEFKITKEDAKQCHTDKDEIAQQKRKIVFATKEIELMHKEIADLKQDKLDITRKCRTAEGIPLQMVGTAIKKVHKVQSFDKESMFCDCGVTKDDDKYLGVKEKRNYQSRIAKLEEDIKQRDKIIKKQTGDIDNLSDTIDRMRLEEAKFKKIKHDSEEKSKLEEKRMIYAKAKTHVQQVKVQEVKRTLVQKETIMAAYRSQVVRYNKETMEAINKTDLAEKKLKRYENAHQNMVKIKNTLHVSKIDVQTKSIDNQKLQTKIDELVIKLDSATKELADVKEKLQQKSTAFTDKLNLDRTKINELSEEIIKFRKKYDHEKGVATKMFNEISMENKKLTLENKSLTLIKSLYIENKKRIKVLTKFNLNKSLKIEKLKASYSKSHRKLKQRIFRYRIPKSIHFSTGNHGASRMIEIPEGVEEPLPLKRVYKKPDIIYVKPYGAD